MVKDDTLVWPKDTDNDHDFWQDVVARLLQHGNCNVRVENFTTDDLFRSPSEIAAEFGISIQKLRQFRADGTLPATFVQRWGKRVEYGYTRRAIKDFLAKSTK